MKKLVSLTAIALLFSAGTALAQVGSGKQAMSTVGDIIVGGGWCGYIIIVLSIASLALAIEHFVTIRRTKIAPPELIDEIEALFEEEEYQDALELCESEPNFLTNMLAAALPKINAGFSAMEKAVEDTSNEESLKLQQKISWISMISNIAPLLGLFGTVLGMIGAFDTITRLGATVTPADLSSGVAVALITTMFGLMVGMPGLFFFFFFKNRVIKLTVELTAIAADLIERFRPQSST
jgi:biopolymer transport protein ExbB